MLKNLISQGNFAIWPEIATVIFAVTFLGILVWVFRKKTSGHYRYMANMILDEQDKQPETEHGR